jgi:hypothetical protein
MIDRDDMWVVRLQEGVKAAIGTPRAETPTASGRWIGPVLRVLAALSEAAMGPPDEPATVSSAQARASRRAARRERRRARRLHRVRDSGTRNQSSGTSNS